MVYRAYTVRREGYDSEAAALRSEWQEQLQVQGLQDVKLLRRYDLEGIDEAVFQSALPTVLSEPQTDEVVYELPAADTVFAVEALPGQFDQRADSCSQCIQILTGGERPTVKYATVYLLYGSVSAEDLAKIQKNVLNPVDSRFASMELPETLEMQTDVPQPVPTLTGFTAADADGLSAILSEYALAMDLDDLKFCQDYFREEGRDPTLSEIRMLDTYWSDHCRHTTFLTRLADVEIRDPLVKKSYDTFLEIKEKLGRKDKPVTLMEAATEAMRYLKASGKLPRLDESEEINACTVKTTVRITDADGNTEDVPYLFLFKNETHNHPTEIEPFGGAATCIGGAIRDPLSGRAYVYQAMRVTGAADPTVPVAYTMEGKLPQRKLVTTAAAGYSSYGNQIGLATGLVDELYHSGYAAKRMEIGAVVGAVPEAQVVREVPAPGDKVVLLGGRTGRDGCGGATGSSKSHTLDSLESCGAEVQKGNAPEERKLQRLFRNPEASRMIKRCNDFGAGGVSVAIGELADGLEIDLNAVPKKYEGLDGTELAISESQERMAVVLNPWDAEQFIRFAAAENLEATVVAEVKEEPRLVMKWNGATIVNIARHFLNSNGAEKTARVWVHEATAPASADSPQPYTLEEKRAQLLGFAGDLTVCSRRGLAERFDSTIGAATVLMPFGGRLQTTPEQVMAALFPLEKGTTSKCSVMAYGYDPVATEESPYKGSYTAVIESVTKLSAAGCPLTECYLTFQEYFERLREDASRWGKPLSALLGAMQAQLDLGLASIGGKDSMSGSFESLDVPPTLVSFAVALCDAKQIRSGTFQAAGNRLVLLAPQYDQNGLPTAQSLLANFLKLSHANGVVSARAVTAGGIAEAILKGGLGNRLGAQIYDNCPDLFKKLPGAILVEVTTAAPPLGIPIGVTLSEYVLREREDLPLDEAAAAYDARLENVFPTEVKTRLRPATVAPQAVEKVPPQTYYPITKPRVLIPVFPGTNCEYDSARAFEKAGAYVETLVLKNLTGAALAQSVEEARRLLEGTQILFLPGGFSGGDEPDGSAKLITAFFRNPGLTSAVQSLLTDRGGLIGGICNGFQALIKLGLVPYGEIRPVMTKDDATLTFNTIGRHQSKLVHTRVANNFSPWLSETKVGDVHLVPISHGEGRFVCPANLLDTLLRNGQVATQYVDLQGNPTMDIQYNPNGSVMAIEGITSADGRVFGKMGHSERTGAMLYKNVPGNQDNGMFRGAVKFFA
ncbi:MAG: phosphoribosylformylglycinamidine synthase [Oscillospiraceae bacterium]|jgi:phosphoribosylformylglycinamidine synthase|nr:phosphoribosylformylglycinamidine synthase [Oscillospiraceae bacterium]